jgi:hypothetical protein
MITANRLVAATIIVDPGCPTSGNGQSQICSPSSPANNPKKTIQEGLSIALNGDTLELRGTHPPHDGTCPGTDGRYEPTVGGTQNDVIRIFGKNLTIQPYRYLGPGSGEKVYLEGAVRPSGGWTKCPNATTTPCVGVPAPQETWYATNTIGGSHVSDLLLANGGIAFRILYSEGPGGLTNSHSIYNPKRCSGQSWIPCDSDRFCPIGQTCVSSQPEVDVLPLDTNADGNTDVILARFGPSGPGDARVLTSNNGTFFVLANFTSFVVRGFVFRGFRRQAITVAGSQAAGPLSGLVLTDNSFFYNINEPNNESDYGVSLFGVTSAVIDNNTFAYAVSKGIELEAAGFCSVTTGNKCYGKTGHADVNDIGQQCPNGEICLPLPTQIHISGNWFHHCGDRAILGNGQSGVPGAVFFEPGGGSSASTGAGDYTGSVFQDNLIERGFNAIDQSGYHHKFVAVRLGDNAKGITIRDNVFMDLDSSVIVLEPNPLRPVGAADGVATVNDAEIFNNIFIRACREQFVDDAVFRYRVNSRTEIANTRIYNNTSIDAGCPLLTSEGSCDPGACDGNIFANNHARDGNVNRSVVSYNMNGVFDGNNVHSTISSLSRNKPLIVYQGSNYECSGLPDFQIPIAGRTNYCSTVQFVDEGANNFHVTENAPLLDRGVFVADSNRASSINNTEAGTRALPEYSDNSLMVGVVDIGAQEFRIGNAGFELGVGAGWKALDGGCPFLGVSSGSAVFHTGNKSLKLKAAALGPTCGGVEFPLESMSTNRTYAMTMWVLSSDGSQDKPLRVNGNPCFAGRSPSWQKVSCTFKASDTADSIRIEVGRPAVGSATYYVDDVNVY